MTSQSGWLANQHGLAGPGFALWVLSPVDRTRMVQGHHLGWLALTWLGLLPSVALGIVCLRPSAWEAGAVILQGLGITMLSCLGGTFLSVLAPYRIQPGTSRRSAFSPRTVVSSVLSLLILLVTALAAAGALLAGTLLERAAGLPRGPVVFMASLVCLASMVALYAALLPQAARAFEHRERQVWQVLHVQVD